MCPCASWRRYSRRQEEAGGRASATRNTLATAATPLFNTGAPTELYLGAQLSPQLPINGCLRKITYWPRRMNDAQLRALVP